MLRPQHVIDWVKERMSRNQTDIHQLIDGILVGGQIVIGGAEANVEKAQRLLGGASRVGRLVSIVHAKLEWNKTTTFDAAAVAQLIMIAKNEAFHATAEQVLEMVAQSIEQGISPALALEAARQRVLQVQKL
jgi:hypothetical protein